MKRIVLLPLIVCFSSFNAMALLTTPVQVSPSNGSTGRSPNELLDWSSSAGATGYEYKIGIDPALSGVTALTVSGSSQTYVADLLFGAVYYWQVRAVKTTAPVDSSDWSIIWSFTTLNDVYPVAPSNGAISQDVNVLLDWSAVSGITNYDYEYDTTANFNSPVLFSGISTGSSSQGYTNNLYFGTTYYWRVRARHSADTTAWSAVWSFTTRSEVYQVAPSNGAISQDVNALLDWSAVSGITNYDYEYDTSASFNSLVLYSGISTSSSSQGYTNNLYFGTTYYWRVRARHSVDTTAWSAVWSFTTRSEVYQVAPSNGAISQDVNVLLDWSAVSGITNYDYEYDTTANFNSPVLVAGIATSSSSQAYTNNLFYGTTYYWRVRARHSADTTDWSPVWYFTTLETVYLVSPSNSSMNVNLNPLLDWAPLPGSAGYEYRIATAPDFSNAVNAITGTTTQANLINLSYGTQYFWQVRAFHAADTTDWSSAWNFTTIYQLANAPSLISPADNSTGIPVVGTTFTWSAVTNATTYAYQYDEDGLFNTPVTGQVSGLSTVSGTFLPGTNYYWRVRAGNGSGWSPWSAAWSFTTENPTSVIGATPASAIVAYPNPASDQFYVKGTFASGTRVSLTDGTGRLLFSQDISEMSEQVMIPVAGLADGIYFVEIARDGESQRIRVSVRN